MAPRLDFSDWWTRNSRKGTPVIVTMENPNYSVLEIDGPEEAFGSMEKDREECEAVLLGLLLKAHCAVGCVAWSATALWALLGVIKKRLISRQGVETQGVKPGRGRLLLRVLRMFLVLSVVALAFEFVAYWNGWHFQKPNLQLPENLRIPETTEIPGWLHSAYLSWLLFRADYIAHPIRMLTNVCILLFIIQSADRMILCLGCFWIKLKKIKPRLDGDSFKEYEHPMVLIQIPMCNEREVYEQSISAVCQIDWPKDRMLIQVLDDSDDEAIRILIRAEVSKWSQRGANIVYRHRLVRTGYKAGNLKSAMGCDYGNPELGLVQARWSFVNKDENLLTRLQYINLCFHFEVEQQVNGVLLNFFGFNGTAGVWRIKALEDSGGWLERTTVEDMDIAVRAHLHGWKFIFLNDVKEVNPSILFFHIVLCNSSLTMFVPEAELPVWVICYVPVLMSFLNILPAPRSFPFIVPYLLFENTMSVTKFNAMVSGLFQLGGSYEWIVTKKTGRSSESDLIAAAERESKSMSLSKSTKVYQKANSLPCVLWPSSLALVATAVGHGSVWIQQEVGDASIVNFHKLVAKLSSMTNFVLTDINRSSIHSASNTEMFKYCSHLALSKAPAKQTWMRACPGCHRKFSAISPVACGVSSHGLPVRTPSRTITELCTHVKDSSP
ncbi:hypothetical protein MUK42_33420 [Musa troglodytarum]|uniref:Glycosyltransferase 2-like domain-containing protein n=1 Tax=Musa troglodytarum TaxID=320322 RepID=A0A9E7I0N0_9LILI|nr:hypothetical protein MUK42_33420 [Musa troglodytarum]